LRPFDGERAEKRCDVVWVEGASLGATELSEATEPVEDLRRPPKDMDSRLPLRGMLDVEVELDTWRGTRDAVLDEGDARMDCRCVTVVSVAFGASLMSNTPNSSVMGAGLFIDPEDPFPGVLPGVGDGSFPATEDVTIRLVRRLAVVEDVDGFRAGDDTVDVRLWMRGILVGVSLGFTPTPFGPDEGGKSRSFISRLVCELLPPVPTEGDPAIVGSCVRLRSDVSDCRCRELIVCAVARDDMTLLRVAVAEPFEGGVAFRFATR